MALRHPEGMHELVYFTNRTLENNGKLKAWAYRLECPECKEGTMGKPVEKGKIKRRATEYVCGQCGYKEEKKEHEPKLTVEIAYTCPHCGHSGETTTEYKRRTFKGVPAYVFVCENCKEKIGITKKMK
ncbi:MAG: hypothetical protein ACOCQX_00625 [Candidatus Nanoarchaeia archaeon]